MTQEELLKTKSGQWYFEQKKKLDLEYKQEADRLRQIKFTDQTTAEREAARFTKTQKDKYDALFRQLEVRLREESRQIETEGNTGVSDAMQQYIRRQQEQKMMQQTMNQKTAMQKVRMTSSQIDQLVERVLPKNTDASEAAIGMIISHYEKQGKMATEDQVLLTNRLKERKQEILRARQQKQKAAQASGASVQQTFNKFKDAETYFRNNKIPLDKVEIMIDGANKFFQKTGGWVSFLQLMSKEGTKVYTFTRYFGGIGAATEIANEFINTKDKNKTTADKWINAGYSGAKLYAPLSVADAILNEGSKGLAKVSNQRLPDNWSVMNEVKNFLASIPERYDENWMENFKLQSKTILENAGKEFSDNWWNTVKTRIKQSYKEYDNWGETAKYRWKQIKEDAGR